MKNYDEGSIVASLSPILDWRGVVSWSVIPVVAAWRRLHRMAALSVREPRSVCVSWRERSRRYFPFRLATVCFHAFYRMQWWFNSVANPSPRQSGSPSCSSVPIHDEPSRRETFLAFCVSLCTRVQQSQQLQYSCVCQHSCACFSPWTSRRRRRFSPRRRVRLLLSIRAKFGVPWHPRLSTVCAYMYIALSRSSVFSVRTRRSMCFCVYNRCVLSLRLALLSPAARRYTGVPPRSGDACPWIVIAVILRREEVLGGSPRILPSVERQIFALPWDHHVCATVSLNEMCPMYPAKCICTR